MSVAIVTGAGGLVGAEAVGFLYGKGLGVIGIDNDTRRFPARCPGWRLTGGIAGVIQDTRDVAVSRAEAA